MSSQNALKNAADVGDSPSWIILGLIFLVTSCGWNPYHRSPAPPVDDFFNYCVRWPDKCGEDNAR